MTTTRVMVRVRLGIALAGTVAAVQPAAAQKAQETVPAVLANSVL